MTTIVNGRLVTPTEILNDAVLRIDQGRILACGPQGAQSPETVGDVVDAAGRYLLPGFVDIHCHGGAGAYVHEAPDAVASLHLRHGTTSLVATCVILERAELLEAVRMLQAAQHPAIAGIHLEGPYLSSRYGAKREMSRLPDPDEYHALLDAGCGRIRIWTFAPELDGTDAFVSAALQHDVVLSVGHSEADARRIFELAARGMKLGCHLMCATGTSPKGMGGVREPGVDEAVMVHDDLYAEVIPDSLGVHVRPLMLKLLLKAKGVDKTIIITDAVRDAGVGDNAYRRVQTEDLTADVSPWRELQNLPSIYFLNAEQKAEIDIADDINVSALGRLSGSKLTMDHAVRNMMQHTGVGLVDACRMASLNPARLLGIDAEAGSLEVGKRANLVIASEKIEISRVMLDGVWVD